MRILYLALILLIVACGSSKTSNSTAEKTETTPQMGVDDFSKTITSEELKEAFDSIGRDLSDLAIAR